MCYEYTPRLIIMLCVMGIATPKLMCEVEGVAPALLPIPSIHTCVRKLYVGSSLAILWHVNGSYS